MSVPPTQARTASIPCSEHVLAFALIAFSFGAVPRATAQSPTLVVDANQATLNQVLPSPERFTSIGTRTLFTAFVTKQGGHLWTTNGTAGGTSLLLPPVKGGHWLRPSDIVQFNGRFWFQGTDSATGSELWSSDGTAGGTGPFDITPGPGSTLRGSIFAGTSFLFFQGPAANSLGDSSIWRTTGTTGGSIRVGDFQPAVRGRPWKLRGWAEMGGKVYMSLDEPYSFYPVLWETDGGPNSLKFTTYLIDPRIQQGNRPPAPERLVVYQGMLWFPSVHATYGTELAAATGAPYVLQFKDINPGIASSYPRHLAVAGGKLFFAAMDPFRGLELHVLNGAAATPVLVKDIRNGSGSGITGPIHAFGPEVWFQADDGTGPAIWSSDGTAAGTVRRFTSTAPYPGFWIVGATSSHLFLGQRGSNNVSELFSTNGRASPLLVGTDILPANPTPNGARLWFTNDGQPWVSDGSPGGTRKVATIDSRAAGSAPEMFAAGDGRAFMTLDDGVSGRELWIRDQNGTRLLMDIFPGMTGSDPEDLCLSGVWLYFTADDGKAGRELWRTDGVATHMIRDIYAGVTSSEPRSLTAFRGGVLFQARDPSAGREMFFSDGTAAGTRLVLDIYPGLSDSHANGFVVDGGRALFLARDAMHGPELWTTDGTAGGTTLIKDINPGSLGSSTAPLVRFRGRYWFRAQDGSAGEELFVTDGTPAGTTMFYDVAPGSASSRPAELTVAGDRLFFTAYVGFQQELWVTDGRTNTMKLITLPTTSAGMPANRSLVAAGNRLFFASRERQGFGNELWTSDGTIAGTRIVRDICKGVGDGLILQDSLSGDAHFATSGGLVFFTANDGETDAEGWVSDGTAAGTRKLLDVWPGVFGSNPREWTTAGGTLFFSANDGKSGEEPWMFDLSKVDHAAANSFGSGCPGTAGRVPSLAGVGLPTVGNANFALRVAGGRANAAAVIALGPVASVVQLPPVCALHTPTMALAIGVRTDATGAANYGIAIPNQSSLLGLHARAQGAIDDPQGAFAAALSLTNGVFLAVGN